MPDIKSISCFWTRFLPLLTFCLFVVAVVFFFLSTSVRHIKSLETSGNLCHSTAWVFNGIKLYYQTKCRSTNITFDFENRHKLSKLSGSKWHVTSVNKQLVCNFWYIQTAYIIYLRFIGTVCHHILAICFTFVQVWDSSLLKLCSIMP